MNVIRNFLKIFSVQTFVVIGVSVSATYACLQFGIAVELPTTLIGIAIVFPIVFSINAAYRRREEALRHFASLKAHCLALYYAHRDWLPEPNPEHAVRARELTLRLLVLLRQSFTVRAGNGRDVKEIFALFSEFSLSMESLRAAGVSGSEISRANQYLRSIIFDFERMRNILTYRTPTSLRAYSQVFLNAFPVLFAPYFADLSAKHFTALGLLVAVFYSLVLVSLDNIQELLEDPFDDKGVDDVNLNVSEEYAGLMSGSDES